jgi:hypothetical protein
MFPWLSTYNETFLIYIFNNLFFFQHEIRLFLSIALDNPLDSVTEHETSVVLRRQSHFQKKLSPKWASELGTSVAFSSVAREQPVAVVDTAGSSRCRGPDWLTRLATVPNFGTQFASCPTQTDESPGTVGTTHRWLWWYLTPCCLL